MKGLRLAASRPIIAIVLRSQTKSTRCYRPALRPLALFGVREVRPTYIFHRSDLRNPFKRHRAIPSSHFD